MSDTLHDRIRAGVAETRAEGAFLRFCDHADRILDRHREVDDEYGVEGVCDRCVATYYPCAEVRDLAEAWGVEQ